MPDETTSPRELADEFVTTLGELEPTLPTLYGMPGPHDRMADLTEANEERFRERFADLGRRAEAIDAASLTPEDATTRAVVIQQADVRVRDLDTKMVEYTLTDLFIAPASRTLQMLPMTALPTAELAEAYLGRLAAIPAFLAQAADRHRAGVAAGRVPVAHLVDAAVRHLDRYLSDPDHDPLTRPAPPEGALTDFAQRRDRVLADTVRPAFAAYRDVLANEIAGHGRPTDRPGLSWLPGGDRYYADLVRVHTSTDRTPDDVHRTGLDIIEGLRAEYAELGAKALGTSDVGEIFARLRTDDALRWTSADELLESARHALTRAEAVAPEWFGVLPAQSCQVQAVPEADAPNAPPAYYIPPSLDGERSGVYYANVDRVTERFRHQSETMAFHEAVPGHHLQISISQELPGLPMLRRLADVTAYAEGWGLYSERLADEMGLYSDDVARIGMLTADSMRAGRLVVDTGLHAKGWSRQQAVDFLAEHTPMAGVEIETEIDRYIAYPGQALSYMVGRLEIQRIRADAEAALGGDFDIRGFHDVVLGNGPLPLSVLSDVVGSWVAGRRH